MDCLKCVFCENVVSSGGPWGGTQTGCATNRLDIFKSKGKAELKDSSYTLSQFCNTYRSQDWAQQHEGEDLIELVNKEVQCTFGLVILNDSKDKEKLQQTIQSIKNIDYDKNKFGIILSVNQSKVDNVLYYVDIAQQMQQAGYYFRFTMHSYEDKQDFREWECFMKVASAGYISKIKSGQCVHANSFNIINDEVNNKLNQVALFDHTSNDITIVNKSVASHSYGQYGSFDVMVDNVRKQAQKDNLYLKV